MRLFHFSEESSIEIFVPRVKENRRDMPPVVWAIDDAHEFTFYFPRDCPRIVYTRSNEITDEDNIKFFGTTKSDIVVTVENDWYERIKRTTIYRYRLPTDGFRQGENFRHFRHTGQPLDSRLALGQILALRFAEDEEFLVLCQKAVETGMTNEAIKKSITRWRADHIRV
ncbi:DUF6886 family protein [Cohnella kolymensis]|uniref:DUF6886 family protein n=1 Tax=Cohnella kolymensis TaxID=1590652 RepID=UPI0009E34EBA|nr:DUF6886 family protein [Cohnella kolymensis]